MIVPARMPAAIRARPPATVAMSVPYCPSCLFRPSTCAASCGLKMPSCCCSCVLTFWICAFACAAKSDRPGISIWVARPSGSSAISGRPNPTEVATHLPVSMVSPIWILKRWISLPSSLTTTQASPAGVPSGTETMMLPSLSMVTLAPLIRLPSLSTSSPVSSPFLSELP